MIHQEPDALKIARPVLRGGKLAKVYLSRLYYRHIATGGYGVEISKSNFFPQTLDPGPQTLLRIDFVLAVCYD